MPRATIRDVAKFANLSISTVNRALHEPDKVREETLQAVLQAAEAVGFYGISSLRDSLKSTRPKVRIGILLLQRRRAFYTSLSQAITTAAEAVRDHEVRVRTEHLEELSPQRVADGLNNLAETCDVLGVVGAEHPIVAATIEALAER